MARRVCGSTNGVPALSRTLRSNVIGAVRCPQPRKRGTDSSATPVRAAHLRATSSDASNTATAPSVTWLQSSP
jgi:hypothetical protein